MLHLLYANGKSEAFAADCGSIAAVPIQAQLPAGFQAVLYEEENWRGNSVVLDASARGAQFPLEGLLRGPARSLRVLETGEIPPTGQRDAAALAEALAPGGWLQEDLANTSHRLEWWREATFGCFVHWGVYAVAGGEWKGRRSGYAEHIERVMQFTQVEYKAHFIDQFNPVYFDAQEWIRAVKAAGMRYFIVTAKHHDGFAMYPSQACPYDIRMTPFHRDPMMELREACRREGIRFGLYYSHAFDWEHPDAPGNDWEYTNGGGDRRLFEGPRGLWFDEHPELVPRTARYYVDGKSIPQIMELIKTYRPDLLWFDTAHKLPFSENLRILRAIREADPDIIVNGRLAPVQGIPTGDYLNTGDRAAEFFPTDGPWETIPTTNESYGYSKVDKSHKPPEHFIRLLAKCVARGGNMLMNVGPTALGKIDAADLEILKGIGEWMKINDESIYGASRSPLCVQPFGETTLKGNTLYLHVFERGDGKITLAGVINHIKKAYLLADPGKHVLPTRRLNCYDTEITLPEDLTDSCDTVIAVEFEGELLHDGGRLLSRKNVLRAFDAYISPELSHGDGKAGRDYLYGWTHPEQAVLWRVRPAAFGTYQLRVHYTTEAPDAQGSYSIFVNGVKRTGQIVPAKNVHVEFTVELRGEGIPGSCTFDIVFRPEEIKGDFLYLYGLSVALVAQDNPDGTPLDEDETDTGDT